MAASKWAASECGLHDPGRRGHDRQLRQHPSQASRLARAFSASLGDSFLLNVDGFYTKQKQGAYDVNAVPDGLNHNVATLIPTAARGTGVTFVNPTGPTGAQAGDWNQQFYTTQNFNYYLGSFRSATTSTQTDSAARNFTAKLTFDNGGPFTATLALADNTATSRNAYADIQFVQADGTAWGNHLMPGVSLPPRLLPRPIGKLPVQSRRHGGGV